MNRKVYTGILGEIQQEYEKDSKYSFNPENMASDFYCKDLSDYKFIEFTGDDGYGETCHLIFMWKGKYYRLNGFSQKSYYGADWYGDSESVREVTAKVVEQTIYV